MSAETRAPAARAGSLPPVFLFALLFTALFLLHAPLLRLPYFWDEAGYFVPAARDLLLTGDPIPHSVASSAHPPLLMAYLALWWRLSGYKPAVTRVAMLLVAAFGLLGVFRLARRVSCASVAAATTLCTALYPVFFAQSSLAQADLPAAALDLWGLAFCVEDRRRSAAVMFALAALSKETAILVPAAVFAWEVGSRVFSRNWARFAAPASRLADSLGMVLIPALPLLLWFAYHFHRTGFIFGNPRYFQLNVEVTLRPARILLTLLRRLWQVTGYMGLFVLTVGAAAAMLFPAQRDRQGVERPRIALPLQGLFALLILAHVVFFSVVGWAVLARYLLVVEPLVILLCVSTLRRRVHGWTLVVGVVCLAFVAGLFVGPPYPYPPEDNLAYRDYVLLHKRAADYLAAHAGHARVLTAWPASDELTKPYLGYVLQPIDVVRIDDFSAPQVALAAPARSQYDFALLFSTKYEPGRDLLDWLPAWQRLQQKYFDYHRDLPPELAARMLGGNIVLQAQRGGEWIAVVDLQHVENAAVPPARFPPAAIPGPTHSRVQRPASRKISTSIFRVSLPVWVFCCEGW